MTFIWTILVAAPALCLFLLALIFTLECIFGVLPLSSASRALVSLPPQTRLAVIVPAHDEAAGIAATIKHLREQCTEDDRLVVVADNCTDNTAELARGAGANVIERHDPEHRGKGFAISFALEHIANDPPDVVVLVDADCRLSDAGIATLMSAAVHHRRPIQGEYLFRAVDDDPVAVLSALATLVRNKVRPRGLLRLGYPTHLMGSGMAFPYEVLRACPPLGSHLVEDLLMGIELALLGYPALHCPTVTIRSELPATRAAARGQRRRWEHGQLGTVFEHVPRLLRKGITSGNSDLIALALDLAVPPLALLVLCLVAVGTLAGLLTWQADVLWPFRTVVASLSMITGAVLLSWLRFGRRDIPARYLLLAPLYVLWKVPLYVSLLLGRRERRWERTER